MAKVTVRFGYTIDESISIGTSDTVEQGLKMVDADIYSRIKAFKSQGVASKSHYIRQFVDHRRPDVTVVDYGSWSTFYFVIQE